MASASILERGFAANDEFLGDITHPYQKRNSAGENGMQLNFTIELIAKPWNYRKLEKG
jgi:hypothetical protein